VVGGVITGTSTSVTGSQTAASTVGGVITGTSTSVTGSQTAASTVGGVITGTSSSVTGTQTAASTVGGVITGTSTSVTGNISGANVNVSANISATANITASYFIGNGSQLTGINASNIVGGYGNANVATFLANFGSNTISTTGTINSGNITGGNVLTGGLISATGNITGNYIIANASALTGTIQLANVANLLNLSNVDSGSSSQFFIPFTAAGGASIPGPSLLQVDQAGAGLTYFPSTGTLYTGIYSAAGNVIAAAVNAAIIGNTSASLVGGTASLTANVTGGNLLTGGLISATANVTGGNVLGTNVYKNGVTVLNANDTIDGGTY
jgi:hypothetical protein